MSKTPRILGVTGGIATGKTTVLKELKRQGIPVISSDELAHACLRPGQPIARRIIDHFGRGVVRGGQIDRKALGKIVFSDPQKRHWLERQIHPQVIQQLKAFSKKHPGLVAMDIPLLFEAKLEKLVDAIILVGSSTRTQVARIRLRDGLSAAEARRRIRAQWPLSYKRKRAHHYVLNEGTRAALRHRVRDLLKRLQNSA